MASGASCSVGVTFTPGAAGARSAALTIADNTVAATHTIALSGAGTAPAPAPAPAAPAAKVVPAPAPVIRPVTPIVTQKLTLDALSVNRSISLRSAQRKGLHVTVFTPQGTRVVKVRLLRNGHVITRSVRTVTADGVLTITLPSSAKGRRSLRRGTYTIQVTPGSSPSNYGATTSRTIRIR